MSVIILISESVVGSTMFQFAIYFHLKKRASNSVYVHGLAFSADRSSTLCVKFQPKDQDPFVHNLKLTPTDCKFSQLKNRLVVLNSSELIKYFNPSTGKFHFNGQERDAYQYSTKFQVQSNQTSDASKDQIN